MFLETHRNKLLYVLALLWSISPTHMYAASNATSSELIAANRTYLEVRDCCEQGLDVASDSTLEAWIKVSAETERDMVVVGKYDGDAGSDKRSYALSLNAEHAGQINVLISDGSSHKWISLDHAIPVREWHHLAGVYSASSGTVEFYLDGLSLGRIEGAPNSIHESDIPFRIGATSVGSKTGGFFDGLIDEVRVWSVARTGEEIRRDMRRVLTGSEPGLEGYWRMENDFNDLSPNGNHLIPENGPTFSEDVPFFEGDGPGGEQPDAISASEELLNGLVSYWPMDEESGVREDVHGGGDLQSMNAHSSSGVQNRALELRAAEHSYLAANQSDMEAESSSAPFSYSFWVRLNNYPSNDNFYTILSRWVKSENRGTYFNIDYVHDNGTNILRLYYASNSEYVVIFPVQDIALSFHHVVAVVDPGTQKAKLYINGLLVGSTGVDFGDAHGIENSFFEIGRFRDGNGNILPRYTDGLVDEVGVWNRALTAEEVAMLYNDGKGLPYGVGGEPDDAVSSVAFLPGIMGSRLYTANGEGEEQKRWESVLAGDILTLAMREDGTSQSTALYTRDVIDEIRPVDGLGSFGDAYGGWIRFMNDLVTEGTLKEWKALPYDWRLATDELFLHGRDLGEGRVSYVTPLPTEGEGAVPFLLSELTGLAERSPTGKVTIVAHSNGGLVAKNLLRYLEATDHPLLGKIDALVLVASPQAGTPKALREMLHGMDMPAQQTLRDVVVDMPGAYGLLPSPHLMTLLTEPVVEASENVRTLPLMQDMAGRNITAHEDLRKFLIGELGTRSELSTLGYLHPNLLNAPLLASSTAMHAGVDTWKAPAGVRVVQMVGAGLWTPRGIAYSAYDRRTSSGTTLKSLRTEWLANMDGDGTVLARSAESGEADETYYLNMRRYNEFTQENHAHGNILSTTPAQVLIEQVVLKGLPNVPLHLSTTMETERPPRFEARVYSPVDIHLYGGGGKHTGVTGESPTDLGRYYEAEIPNSYYEEWADVKYAGAVLSSDPVELALDGTDEGEFTLEIDKYEGGNHMVPYRWHRVPVRAVSRGSLFVEEGGEPKLAYDYDGDGDVDRTLASGEVFEPWMAYEVSFVGLREAIRDAKMATSLETWFLARVTLAQQLYKKSGKGNVISAKVVLESVARSAELQSGKGVEPGAAKTIATLARAVGAGL